MIRVVNDLRSGSHMLDANLRTMVASPDFLEAVRRTDQDEDSKTYLMLAALEQIALDPLVGDTPEAFYCKVEPDDDSILFIIQFDRMVNFIGMIQLPKEGPRARQLIAAMKANLNSKMFKAAKLHRRLDERRTTLYNHAAKQAEKVKQAVLARCRTKYRPTEQEWAEAQAEYQRDINRRMSRVDRRIRAIEAISHPGFRGGYTESVAGFLYRHLPYCH